MTSSSLQKLLDRLERWFSSHCDGEWESTHGITIETLAEPGWMLTIHLEDTPLEYETLDRVQTGGSPSNWMWYEVDNARFRAQGDFRKLPELIEAFCNWARLE